MLNNLVQIGTDTSENWRAKDLKGSAVGRRARRRAPGDRRRRGRPGAARRRGCFGRRASCGPPLVRPPS